MNALEKLKTACLKKRAYRSFNILPPGEYIVGEFKKIQTKYGPRLRILIDDYLMLLPERCILDDADIEELNSAPCVLVYGGKNPAEKNRLILDFHDVDYIANRMFKEKE